jgi:hypothetical protein
MTKRRQSLVLSDSDSGGSFCEGSSLEERQALGQIARSNSGDKNGDLVVVDTLCEFVSGAGHQVEGLGAGMEEGIEICRDGFLLVGSVDMAERLLLLERR